jgi:hypothetical protein
MDSNSIAKQIEKRRGEIEKILNEFLKNWNSVDHFPKIKAKKNAAEIISNTYFDIIRANLKGLYLKQDGFINRYKVASGTEIACMLVMPLKLNDLSYKKQDGDLEKLNARLASYLAFQILNGLHFVDNGYYLQAPKNEITQSAYVNHTYWIRYFEVDDNNAYPIFLNSTFWEMYVSAIVLEVELEKK